MNINRDLSTSTTVIRYTYIDIIACTVNLVVCLQTLIIFYERFISVKKLYNRDKTQKHYFIMRITPLTGVMASISGIIYSIYRLIYWFIGINNYLTCDSLLLVGGCSQASCIALILLHLFLRADLINHDNNKNWKICRIIAIFSMCLNVICFSIYVIMRKVYQLPNGRCMFVLNQTALIARYSAQTINHITQTLLFVYPLVYHINNIKNLQKQHQLMCSMDNMIQYIYLVRKSIAAMIISAFYTLGLLIYVGFYKNSITVKKTIVFLSIFDMTTTIASVCYASTDIKKDKFRRRFTVLTTRTSTPCRRLSYVNSNISSDNEISNDI